VKSPAGYDASPLPLRPIPASVVVTLHVEQQDFFLKQHDTKGSVISQNAAIPCCQFGMNQFYQEIHGSNPVIWLDQGKTPV